MTVVRYWMTSACATRTSNMKALRADWRGCITYEQIPKQRCRYLGPFKTPHPSCFFLFNVVASLNINPVSFSTSVLRSFSLVRMTTAPDPIIPPSPNALHAFTHRSIHLTDSGHSSVSNHVHETDTMGTRNDQILEETSKRPSDCHKGRLSVTSGSHSATGGWVLALALTLYIPADCISREVVEEKWKTR